MNRFSFLLHCGKKFIHGYLGVILIEVREELSLQIDPRNVEPGGRLINQSKATTFESPDKQSGNDDISIYYITSLAPEVIDMLVQ